MRGDGIGFSDADLAALAEIAREVEAAHAAINAAEARRARALARAGDLARRQAERSPLPVREREMSLRAIAAELAGILRTSDRSTQRQIDDAGTLVECYPRTVEAWEQSRITRGHVRLIADLGAPLPPEDRARFETVAVAACETDTPGRLRSPLRLAAERLHPRTLAERHRDARDTRNVRVVDVGDGMSELIATLPATLAHAIHDRLTAQGHVIVDARNQARTSARDESRARPAEQPVASDASGTSDAAGATGTATVSDSGAGSGSDPGPVSGRFTSDEILATDERTLDQIRADVFADMQLASDVAADPTRDDDGPGALGAIRARVQIVVPALTLLGADDGPADLVGRSPVDPDTARILAASTRHPLERVLTDPVTGSVVEVDAYQRPASLDRYLRARDRHCRFPGCWLPAVRCEVDHTHDHALGGRTRRANLAHLCQRHHSMKQFTPWRVRQLDHGVIEWTSPLGRVYTDRPPAPVTFVPDVAEPPPDPPPF